MVFSFSLFVCIRYAAVYAPWVMIGGIVGCVVSAVLGGANIAAYMKRGFKYDQLRMNIVEERIKDTNIKIPFGAKKQCKKAMDTGIFTHFTVSHPNMTFDDPSKKLCMNNLDPALCGKTIDGRTFLICWWDMKKDEDRTPQNIDWIKKFKIEQ